MQIEGATLKHLNSAPLPAAVPAPNPVPYTDHSRCYLNLGVYFIGLQKDFLILPITLFSVFSMEQILESKPISTLVDRLEQCETHIFQFKEKALHLLLLCFSYHQTD